MVETKGPKRRRLLDHRRRAAIRWGMRDDRARRFALRHLFGEHLTANALCAVNFGDHELFVDPRDDKIAYTVLSGRPWQRRQFDAAMAAMPPARSGASNGVFVDVGANIGTMSIYAALSGKFSRIIAIEPDDYNRALLERNIRHNDLADRVTVVATAVSNRSGRVLLHRDTKNLGAHSLEEGFSKSQSETCEVDVETLDTIVSNAELATTDIAFVKIDVEGHEYAVLEGMGEILKTTPPVMLEVSFDVHSDQGLSDRKATLKKFPSSYETCTLLDTTEPTTLPLNVFRPTSRQHDLLIS